MTVFIAFYLLKWQDIFLAQIMKEAGRCFCRIWQATKEKRCNYWN